ncbi:MAG: acetyl-CoA carboxylase, carboxyltransferase subunit beta [Planctomycetota bacterium]|nr:acetyl-CoA carboxylase, carboxyltransferase subunit beta [Planctomycetota bacterium]
MAQQPKRGAGGKEARESKEPAVGPERKRRVQTEGQFIKCPNRSCSQSLFIKDIEKNFHCCKSCGHHFRVGSRRRVEITIDPGTWVELFDHLESIDPLQFKGKRSYLERIKESQEKTGLRDAVICGEARIEGIPLVFCAMDFQFMGGSMGSVVGEKIARAIEHGTKNGWAVVIVCCSGGARMDEGVLSLMQMAKTSAAIERHNAAGLAYITVLSDPTMAGVSASYAFLADVIIGEPKAMIGFAGARVIEQTIRKKLPEGFQTAEFLLKHGQIDMVVPRSEMRGTLAKILRYATVQRQETPRTAKARSPKPSGSSARAKAEPVPELVGAASGGSAKKSRRR